jgi:hypothetical protein
MDNVWQEFSDEHIHSAFAFRQYKVQPGPGQALAMAWHVIFGFLVVSVGSCPR